MNAYYSPIVRLSDGETWAQMTDRQTREPLEFATESDAREWVGVRYPDYIRPDVFHGLQPIKIAQINRKIA